MARRRLRSRSSPRRLLQPTTTPILLVALRVELRTAETVLARAARKVIREAKGILKMEIDS